MGGSDSRSVTVYQLETQPNYYESTPNMASNAIYVEAINQAIIEEMARDESVFIMGEDIRRSVYGATAGLLDQF